MKQSATWFAPGRVGGPAGRPLRRREAAARRAAEDDRRGVYGRAPRAFRTHLEETRGHVERLERVFSDLGMPMPIEQCKAMRGLVAEGDEIVLATGDPVAKDAALIAVAQRVEHYEIAGYGTVRPPGVKRRRPEGWARPSLRPMNSLIASRCGAVAFRRR